MPIPEFPLFSCPEHQQPFVDKGGIYTCNNTNCKRLFTQHDGIYDLVNTPVSDVWDQVFRKSENVNFAKKYFDKFLARYLAPIFNDYLIKELEQFSEGSKFIELGCGEATASMRVLLKKNYSIVLLDLNDIVLQNITQAFRSAPLKGSYAIVKGDFYNDRLSFPEKYFDVGYNVGTLEHFEDPVRSVREMKRVARKVICLVPAWSFWWRLSLLVRRLIEKDATLWTLHTNFYTLKELEDIFTKAGLTGIKTYQTKFLGLAVMNYVIGNA